MTILLGILPSKIFLRSNMMRYFAFCILLSSSLAVFAQDGKAIIPVWEKNVETYNQLKTSVYISNISNETVTVFLDMYDADGNRYTEATETTSTNIRVTGNLSGDPISTSGASLGPGETGTVVFENGDIYRGYGVIHWTCSEQISYALVANVLNLVTDTDTDVYSRSFIPVNKLRPF